MKRLLRNEFLYLICFLPLLRNNIFGSIMTIIIYMIVLSSKEESGISGKNVVLISMFLEILRLLSGVIFAGNNSFFVVYFTFLVEVIRVIARIFALKIVFTILYERLKGENKHAKVLISLAYSFLIIVDITEIMFKFFILINSVSSIDFVNVIINIFILPTTTIFINVTSIIFRISSAVSLLSMTSKFLNMEKSISD